MPVLEAHVVSTLLVCDGKVWVARRKPNVEVSPGLVECPGGKMEGGETELMAARREVREETGLDIGFERFRARGQLYLNGRWCYLFMVELGRHERPKDTEPDKRDRWILTEAGGLKPKRSIASLGALCALYCYDQREA